MTLKKSYKDYLLLLNSEASSLKGQQQSPLHYQQINGWDKPDVYDPLFLSIRSIEQIIKRLKTFPEYNEADINRIITDNMSMDEFISFKGFYLELIDFRPDSKKLCFKIVEDSLDEFDNQDDVPMILVFNKEVNGYMAFTESEWEKEDHSKYVVEKNEANFAV